MKSTSARGVGQVQADHLEAESCLGPAQRTPESERAWAGAACPPPSNGPHCGVPPVHGVVGAGIVPLGSGPVGQGNTTGSSSTPPPHPSESPRESGGFDWLEGSLFGQWDRRAFELLTQAIEATREENGEDGPSIQRFDFAGEDHFCAKGGSAGKFSYKYGLTVQGIRIWIMNRWKYSERVPLVRFEASSVPCMELTGEGVWEVVRDYLGRLGFDIARAVPSRVDLCVDLAGVGASELIELEESGHSISKARTAVTWRDRGTGIKTAVRVGAAGAPVMLRIYDKLRELLGAGKDGKNSWKVDYLVKNRWGGELPEKASRVEFQLRRGVLREMEVHSFDDLFRKAAQIWEYLTTEWYRVADRPVERESKNQSRYELHELWERVLEAGHKVGWLTHASVERVRKRGVASCKNLARQIGGCLSSWLAKIKPSDQVSPTFTVHDGIELLYQHFIKDEKEFRRFVERWRHKAQVEDAMRCRRPSTDSELSAILQGVPF